MSIKSREQAEDTMSVNYYVCGPFPGGDGQGLHIGQSVTGWIFLFRAHDDLGLTSRAAWAEFLERPGVVIRVEQGREVPASEMVQMMSARRDQDGRLLRRRGLRSALAAHPHWADRYLVDVEGYELSHNEFC